MADDPRHFEAGNLLYSNTDGSDPLTAVGVILGQDGETGATALVGNGEANARLILRDLSRQVPVRLVEKVG
jgi:sarcosine oxidase subunit alpha